MAERPNGFSNESNGGLLIGTSNVCMDIRYSTIGDDGQSGCEVVIVMGSEETLTTLDQSLSVESKPLA